MTDTTSIPLVSSAASQFDDIARPDQHPGPEAAVTVRGLTKFYGSLAAVDRIDLDIAHGAVFGLIGPNGAGKSTLMSMMASLLLPSTGFVRVLGHDPVAEPAAVRSKKTRIASRPSGP